MLLADASQNLSAAWSGVPYKVKADFWLEDGEEIQAAGFEITTILTPGHTSGSCCYWIKEETCFQRRHCILRKLRQM